MRTIPDIIKALGGGSAITARLGFRYASRVSNWPHIGIPRQHWPELLDFAGELGMVDLTWEALREANAQIESGPREITEDSASATEAAA